MFNQGSGRIGRLVSPGGERDEGSLEVVAGGVRRGCNSECIKFNDVTLHVAWLAM